MITLPQFKCYGDSIPKDGLVWFRNLGTKLELSVWPYHLDMLKYCIFTHRIKKLLAYILTVNLFNKNKNYRGHSGKNKPLPNRPLE